MTRVWRAVPRRVWRAVLVAEILTAARIAAACDAWAVSAARRLGKLSEYFRGQP